MRETARTQREQEDGEKETGRQRPRETEIETDR